MSTTAQLTRVEKREARRANPDRLPFGKLVAWAGAGLSAGANFIVLSYLTLYATDVLGLTPAAIGGIISAATLVNALMGFVGAWIVDRSPETRWGKARPYELAVPLTWLATALLFATPVGLRSGVGAIAWVAGMFLVIKAICDPLLRANDVLYMARAFKSRMVYAKVQTRSGIITALGSVIVSVTLPRMLAGAGDDAGSWSRVITVYAVILGVLGLSRFAFVKELTRTEVDEPKIRVADIVDALRSNRWVWVLAGMQFAAAAVTGANVGAYYFKWVVGDLALQGFVVAFGILLLPALLVVPRLMRRFAVSQIIMVGATLGMIGGLINFAAGDNLPLLIFGLFLTSMAALPISYLMVVLVLDMATFNESRGKRRLESTFGAIVGVFNNAGMAVAAGLVGLVMSASGYLGDAATQTPAALGAIRALFGLLPASLYALVAGLMFLYTRFEKNVLPEAQERVRVHRAAQGNPTVAVAVDTDADGIVEPSELPMPDLTLSNQGIPTLADPSHIAGPSLPVDDDTEQPTGNPDADK